MSSNGGIYNPVHVSSEWFPKHFRLLKGVDFRFGSRRSLAMGPFLFVFSCEGQGRLGISISKKVLKNSVSRNRVRRLVREAFRRYRPGLSQIDLHVIGKSSLRSGWNNMGLVEMENLFEQFLKLVNSSSSRASC